MVKGSGGLVDESSEQVARLLSAILDARATVLEISGTLRGQSAVLGSNVTTELYPIGMRNDASPGLTCISVSLDLDLCSGSSVDLGLRVCWNGTSWIAGHGVGISTVDDRMIHSDAPDYEFNDLTGVIQYIRSACEQLTQIASSLDLNSM